MHQHPPEEDDVEALLDAVGCQAVGAPAILGEIECCRQIALDRLEADGRGVQLGLNLGEPRPQPFLLTCEKIQRNGTSVVSLHELLAFPFQLLALAME
ncbi:MAG: hypothetical protein KGZ40_08110 [Clostridiales bacterium]|nr:hypothetical protein [Clostridiales bacterium]